MRLSGPRRNKLRPEGNNHEDRQAPHQLNCESQQLDRGGIDPVRILEHHQHWFARRQAGQLRQKGL